MKSLWIPLISALLLTQVPAVADTLLVDSINQRSGAASGWPSVSRGMTMEQVERNLGAPVSKLPAVGQPPITRWVYAEHTVYFEHNLVLTSVRKR